MNSLKRIFSEWLGYSRRERRASMILVIIIAVVLSVRYLIPEKGIDVEVSTIIPPSPVVEHLTSGVREVDTVALFKFDPNTASFGDLISLGLPQKVAGTLIRYRNSGGRFRRPEDIYKVYGLDTSLAKGLIPYINISESDTLHRRQAAIRIASSVTVLTVPDRIDINRCDTAELEALPAIGPVLSARIIKYRELLGGYVSVSQLKEVYGVADSAFRIISGLIIIDSAAVRRIDINGAGFRELDRHPYIERYDAQAIIKYREIKGEIESLSELVSNRILTEAKVIKLAPYFSF